MVPRNLKQCNIGNKETCFLTPIFCGLIAECWGCHYLVFQNAFDAIKVYPLALPYPDYTYSFFLFHIMAIKSKFGLGSFLWDSQNVLSMFKAILAAIIFLYSQLLVLSSLSQVLNAGGPF
jgi:hypothetical protein